MKITNKDIYCGVLMTAVFATHSGLIEAFLIIFMLFVIVFYENK